MTDLTITPTGAALGAVVTGIDARRLLDPETVFALRRAQNEHHVLIFPGQTLTQEEQVAFATHFGALFAPPSDIPVLGTQTGYNAAVVTVANGPEGLLGHKELTPHTDHQWTPTPSSGSFLYAIEVPEEGGETVWYDLIAAYESLDEETKTEIAGLRAITYNPFLREPGADDPSPQDPKTHHPLVRTHPESGRKILYLNASYRVDVLGLAQESSDALIERLRAHLLQPQYTYTHRWSVGDLVWWDNQATLHYRPEFGAEQRRVLRRVSLAGAKPF